MRAVVSDSARLQRMLDFQAALARAAAAVGAIPASAAGEIADACRVERYDAAALAERSAATGDPAGPLLAALAAEVARRDQRAAGFVHWGACDRDMIDTALVLELDAAIEVLLAGLDRAIAGFVALAGRHRRTMAAARLAGREVAAVPFGLGLAGHAAALARSRERLRRQQKDTLGVQFGGREGALAALGDHGLQVAERLAALLDLPIVDAPWHGQRDRLAEAASALAILAGTCGQVAREVALSMQSAIAEASLQTPSAESPRPHDPVAAALAAAALAPQLAAGILAAQHEHAAGGWQGEWAAFPALELAAATAVSAMAEIAERLHADIEQMKANLDRPGGLAMAEPVAARLASKIGRAEAQVLMDEIARQAESEKRPLRELVEKDPRVRAHLDDAELNRLFFPVGHVGVAQVFIDRLVGSTQGRFVRRAAPQPKPPPEDKESLAAKLRSVTAAASELGSLGGAKPADAPAPRPDDAPAGKESGAEHEPGAILQVFAQANAQAGEDATEAIPASDGKSA